MTSDQRFTGFIVPADERIQTGKYTETLPHLLQRANIKFYGIVRTEYLNPYDNSVMFVDEDGYHRGLPPNRRAQFLSGYTLDYPIVGDALFLGEKMGMDGAYIVSLTDRALEQYFQNTEVHEGYAKWLWSEPVIEFSERHGLYLHGKSPIRDTPQA
jgi:hypothetical protein